ncbi:MAG: hypothetical protein RBU37_15020 [Myxococcota bacterium]|jgi:hypothetical protein|nr:hypothetical protein [Myxococcota bacterium]
MPRILFFILICTVMLFGCKKEESPAPKDSGPPPAPANPLEAAAKGEYSGPYGSVSFREDGSVLFAYKNCMYESTELGFAKMSPDSGCTEESYEGSLELNPGQIGIRQADASSYLFGAYLDEESKLHMGIGEVFDIGQKKQGALTISPLRTLHLEEKGCRLEDAMKDGEMTEVPCAFVERNGRTVFEFEREDFFDKSKMVKDAYVFLPKLGLLVSPNLVELAFATKR